MADALERLRRGLAGQGEFKLALGYTRRWLALDQLHEPAQRRLMQLYAWGGDQAAALHQYEECLRLLAEELGLPPDAETTTLYEQIGTGALGRPPEAVRQVGCLPTCPAPPFLISSPANRPRHNLPYQTMPFLGRAAELAELARLLAEPAIRLVTILGAGGMGKSRAWLWREKQLLLVQIQAIGGGCGRDFGR